MLACPDSLVHIGSPSSSFSALSSAADTEFPKFLKGKGSTGCVAAAEGRGWCVWSPFLQQPDFLEKRMILGSLTPARFRALSIQQFP